MTLTCFNTASGMRSHVTYRARIVEQSSEAFQYRKRYEITCDLTGEYEQTPSFFGFNTASGMRSHVTAVCLDISVVRLAFQYRKRYEITCDQVANPSACKVSPVSIPQAV